jgi:hypothetical protein
MADPSGLLNAPVDDEAGRGQLEHQVGAIAALPPGADAGIFDHGEGVEQYAGARHIANQARALTTKSLLVLRRRKKSTAAYVLMPSLAILALWGVIVGTAAWLDPSNSAAHRDYPLAQLTVRKCEVFDAATNLATGAPCTTAMFAPAGTNTVSIMRKFAAATGLEYGTDVVAASSPQAVADAIAQSPGSVDAAVIFTRPDDTLGDAAWAPAGASGTPTLEYQLWTNTTGNMGRWLTGDDRHLLDQAGVYLPRREICLLTSADRCSVGTLCWFFGVCFVAADQGANLLPSMEQVRPLRGCHASRGRCDHRPHQRPRRLRGH